MEIKGIFIQDTQGNIIPGATCYLYEKGTSISVTGVVDKDGNPLLNPFVSDANGLVQFGAPNGDYDLRVTSGERDYRLRIQCFDTATGQAAIDEAVAEAQAAAAVATEAVSDFATDLADKTNAAEGAALVGYDGVTAQAVLDENRPLPGYAELRAYNGRANSVRLTNDGVAGVFKRLSTTPVDNGISVIVDGLGRSWARVGTSLNVKMAGALGNSGTDDSAAFATAYAAAPVGGRIIVPASSGLYPLSSIPAYTKEVTWEIQFDPSNNLQLLNLPGTIDCRFGAANMLRKSNARANEDALYRIDRIANYTGGQAGRVAAALSVNTQVSRGALDFEWAILGKLDNNGAGQNVAIYGQGNRRSPSEFTAGGTFAACFEARDFTLEANPTTGLIGGEVDIFANGTDSNNRRVAWDIVVGKGVSSGDLCEAGIGLQVGPTNHDDTQGRFKTAINLHGKRTVGIAIGGTTDDYSVNVFAIGSKAAYRAAGNTSDAQYVGEITAGNSANLGMRLSGAYTSGSALRIDANMAVGFEATNNIRLLYDSTALGLVLKNATAEKFRISTTTGAVSIAGTQVLGPRSTGWAKATGTLKKTTFDTSTITHADLAQVVGAMLNAIIDHGAFGA